MKLKVPGRKKNNEVQPEGQVFDLTGGSTSVNMSVNEGYAASDGKKKKAGVAVNNPFRGKKPFAKRSPEKEAAPARAPKESTFGLIGKSEDAFSVSVRNAEPLIKRLDSEKVRAAWLGDIQLNLATASIVMAMFALVFMAGEIPEMTFFVIPGFPVFMLISTMDSFDGEKIKRIRLYAAAAIAVALVAALIIFRKYIGNGCALIMDHLYDTAEMEQAYIYDRFHIGDLGDEHPNRCMHFASIWCSCLLGLITAFPPARFRRTVAMAVAGFAMIAFAYYGIVPSWACIAIIAAALVLVMADGSLMSSLTVLLTVAIVFGAITLIDPGESYAVSRADENFRDRFALRSSYLDSGQNALDDLSRMEDQMKEQQEKEKNSGSEFMAEHKWIVTLVVILLLLAAFGAAGGLYMKSLQRRQKENRAGIDSSDPRTAIVAMFPYTVKWLQPAGIEPAGKAFETLVPSIRADVSEQYAKRYTDMYELWKEAAYSDHEMTENGRNEMRSFLNDTITMITEKSDLKARLINTVKYAL